MTRQRAIEAEARRIWSITEKLWEGAFQGAEGPPWVKARFMLAEFEIFLRQRNLVLPPSLTVAHVPGHEGLIVGLDG